MLGRGLGIALARKFSHHSCTVGLLTRSQNYPNQLVDKFSANEQTAIALPADLAKPTQIASAFQQFINTFDSVDTLINHDGGRIDISTDQFECQQQPICSTGGGRRNGERTMATRDSCLSRHH